VNAKKRKSPGKQKKAAYPCIVAGSLSGVRAARRTVARKQNHMETLIPEWTEYELVDSGAGKKLERFGEVVLARPEPQATWEPLLPRQRWDAADGEFAKGGTGAAGEWKWRESAPERWVMQRKNLTFWVEPAPSGHVGVFPDQACHWDWIAEVTARAAVPAKVLSLFGHTGLATLAAAAAGAEVTHVDASRKAAARARENQSLSGLSERPIHWVVEDALTFVRREARRGKKYDAIVLDPPRFGRGPDGEIWKLEESLSELLGACAKVLSTSPSLILLNVYVTVLTKGRIEREAERMRSWLQEMLEGRRVKITVGELANEDAAGRRISASVFARGEFARVQTLRQETADSGLRG
jgi:23S rRNA (cytosine1962-C5)-methyltransferase